MPCFRKKAVLVFLVFYYSKGEGTTSLVKISHVVHFPRTPLRGISCENCDMSAICSRFSTLPWHISLFFQPSFFLPWQRSYYKQDMSEIVISAYSLNFSAFFIRRSCMICLILIFDKHSKLILYQFPSFLTS